MPNVTNSRVLLLGTENAADGSLTGVVTGSSQPQHIPWDCLRTFFLIGVGAITGGTVVIEEADYPTKEMIYNGTWSTIVSYPATTFSGNLQLAYHLPPAAYGFVRVRISSPLTGTGTFGFLCSMRSPGSI